MITLSQAHHRDQTRVLSTLRHRQLYEMENTIHCETIQITVPLRPGPAPAKCQVAHGDRAYKVKKKRALTPKRQLLLLDVTALLRGEKRHVTRELSMLHGPRLRTLSLTQAVARHSSHSSSVKAAPEAARLRSLPNRDISGARAHSRSAVRGCGSEIFTACRKSPALRRTGGSGGRLCAARMASTSAW